MIDRRVFKKPRFLVIGNSQSYGGFLAPATAYILAPVARARRVPEAYFLLPHGRAL